MDRTLTRERRAHISAALKLLKRTAALDVWEADDENTVLEKIQKQQYQLVLVPWSRYLKWTHIEGLFGLARLGGPVYAGYAGEPVDAEAFKEIPPYHRFLFLDLVNLAPPEAALLLETLASEVSRTGIRALLSPLASVYTENWFVNAPLGPRIDGVSALPELEEHAWTPRLPAIRSAVGALWSLVFEEGPGKTETGGGGAPRACFQAAADAQLFTLRLFYSLKGTHIKRLIESFWPNREVSQASPRSASQVLLRDADFVRVQAIQETQDLEVVIGFVKSAPSDAASRSPRTLWIEPIAPVTVTEVPYEAPGAASGLKALPVPSGGAPVAEDADASRRKDKMLREAIDRLSGLKRQIQERDQLIQELRMGGVNTAPPPPPPDAEAFLIAFEHHYQEAELEFRDIVDRLKALEAGSPAAADTEAPNLRRRMDALAKREVEWMRTLARVLSAYKQARSGRTAG